jgi:hypothetical protein
MAAGLVNKWKEDAMGQTVRKERQPNVTAACLGGQSTGRYSSRPKKALSLYDLQSLFFAWIAGILVSILVFVGECVIGTLDSRQTKVDDITVFWVD